MRCSDIFLFFISIFDSRLKRKEVLSAIYKWWMTNVCGHKSFGSMSAKTTIVTLIKRTKLHNVQYRSAHYLSLPILWLSFRLFYSLPFLSFFWSFFSCVKMFATKGRVFDLFKLLYSIYVNRGVTRCWFMNSLSAISYRFHAEKDQRDRRYTRFRAWIPF